MLSGSIDYAKKLLLEDYEYSGFEIAATIYDLLYGDDSGVSMENKFIDKF